MALFGKKTSDGAATKTAPKTPDNKAGGKAGGLSFGKKKKDAPVAPDSTGLQTPTATDAGGIEDFSDFSDVALDAAPTATTNGKARAAKADKTPRKPSRPRIVSGTAIGLNIGNDSIKVVELQAKGSEIAVTAMGMVHTPAESISNGVVMSVGALQQALRDLFKQAGIKSKRVTISVAGTGALVVRVIEVPRMSDKELDDNMRVDADRYIPFPPSEVIMDYKALRELPSDPDSPNMDVLLAAAQREIIDLHIKVLEEAKLEARAIEVEPLAVSRALTQTVTKQAQALVAQASNGNGLTGATDDVDYSRVSAIINIGAAGTEISVLRGDILVFTRTVPNGGNALTQALVDYLGLPWHDAERVKREWGDALPPQATNDANSGQSTLDSASTSTAAASGDWSEFGGLNDISAPAPNAVPDDVSTILDDAAPQATPESNPFDSDSFQQRTANPASESSPITGQEPREQHGQKEDDPANKPVSAFDFSGFKFSDDDPAPASNPTVSNDSQSTPGPTSADDLSSAPADAPLQSFSFGDEPASALATPTSSSTDATEEVTAAGAFNVADFGVQNDDVPASSSATGAGPMPFDLGDIEATPVATSAEPIAPASIPQAVDVPASAWNLDDLGLPDVSSPAAATSTATPSASAAANDFPAFDLPNLDATSGSALSAGTPAATGDFDLDTFFNTPDVGAAPTSGVETGLDFGDVAAAGVAGAEGAAGFDPLSFGDDFGANLTSFGAGLSDHLSTGVDAETVYSILHPMLEELANEIRRSLEYHASRFPDAVVQNITLVGGGAQFKNIDAFLTQTLGIPTAIGQPLSRLSVRAPQLTAGYAESNAPVFAVALGLALRDLVA